MNTLAQQLRELANRLDEIDHLVATSPPATEYWPSAIPDQKIPKVTGNISIDFMVAMLGGVGKPTPERDANLAAWAQEHDDKVYVGKWHAGGIDDAAATFVYAYSHTQPGTALTNKVYWQAGLFEGPRAVIAELIGRGERGIVGRPVQQIVDEYPDSQFKQDVLAIV